MSQRKRSRRGGDDGEGSAENPAGSPATTAQSGGTGQSGASKPPVLPAFGFAADILQRRSADAEHAAEVSPEAALAEVDPADPDRIFAFADGLERQSHRGEESVAPQLFQGWVCLTLAGEVFALPVDSVREVLRVSAITRVPHAPYPIRGVTNLRGRVIPVIDLRRRLELAEAELERASRIIVVESRTRLIGLLVDSVRQVLQVDLNQVQPPPDDVMTEQSSYILGVFQTADTMVLLLDVDRVLVVKDSGAE